MANTDTSDRISRFDRADYSARQASSGRRQTTLPIGRLSEDASFAAEPMDEPSPLGDEEDESVQLTGDEKITADHLRGSGWSQTDIENILAGPEQAASRSSVRKASLAQAETHLRSLGWTNSDIARLLVGPEKSHLTAESLFRQHAANSDKEQGVLLQALARSKAQDIKTDQALLAGLEEAHLSPENPAGVEQIISQFAALPDVQKQRFLLLLGAQKSSSSGAPSANGAAGKKASGGSGDDAGKSSSSAGDALPIVRSSLDLLNTALKGLLGSTKGRPKKKGSAPPKEDPWRDLSDDEDDGEEVSDDYEQDTSEADDDFEDSGSMSEDEESSYESLDDSMEPDSESAPD